MRAIPINLKDLYPTAIRSIGMKFKYYSRGCCEQPTQHDIAVLISLDCRDDEGEPSQYEEYEVIHEVKRLIRLQRPNQ